MKIGSFVYAITFTFSLTTLCMDGQIKPPSLLSKKDSSRETTLRVPQQFAMRRGAVFARNSDNEQGIEPHFSTCARDCLDCSKLLGFAFGVGYVTLIFRNLLHDSFGISPCSSSINTW